MSGVLQPWRVDGPGKVLRRAGTLRGAKALADYHWRPEVAVAVVNEGSGERWEREAGIWRRVEVARAAPMFHEEDQPDEALSARRSRELATRSAASRRAWRRRKAMALARTGGES